jgi:hypothetical protein
LNIASRCELVRLSLRPDFWWRMAITLLVCCYEKLTVGTASRGYPLLKPLMKRALLRARRNVRYGRMASNHLIPPSSAFYGNQAGSPKTSMQP